MEDEKIIALFFARDEEAIRQTEQTYGRRLLALADQILSCAQDAEEMVSDTYLRAWNTMPPQWPRFLYGYLAKICRNFSLDRLDWQHAAKRNVQLVSLTQEMETCIPDRKSQLDLDNQELGQLLDRFLRSLSEENQLVFLRRYWFLDTIAQIAQRYQISESAVQMRLSRSKEKLRKFLQKEGISV